MMEENGERQENMEARGNGEMQKNGEKREFMKKHPFLTAILLSVALGATLSVLVQLGSIGLVSIADRGFGIILEFLSGILSGAIIYGGFMIFPLVLTGAEILLFVKGRKNQELHRKGRIFDIVGAVLGALYSLIYVSLFHEVSFQSDWQEQLVNRQTHTPIYTGAWLTVSAVVFMAVIGYLVVNYIPLKKMPPLLLVLGLAAMYLGTIVSVVWGIHVTREMPFDLFLLLPPFNHLLITARTVSCKMWEWQQMAGDGPAVQYQEGKGIFSACNHFLSKAERWPLAAFVLMWPLLGILIGFLILLGQRPDAVIKAFTETSDWNLSQRVAPQNIYYDEHYLCTVAAGGHKRIVKPKRLGVRHGHQVIVNRQLCVANAFEQVLEERTPGFHRAVRHFYDTYGFPVARLIHSKYAADLIYFLMKPLEWIFLIVLYLVDADPESRIAIQYTGKSLADFETAS